MSAADTILSVGGAQVVFDTFLEWESQNCATPLCFHWMNRNDCLLALIRFIKQWWQSYGENISRNAEKLSEISANNQLKSWHRFR